MGSMKKIGKFLCSMKCAIILLLILVLACTAGSLIPQGEVMAYYTSAYSEKVAGAIILFGLDDVFHCGWFVVLTVFLCLNLTFCNLLHFPGLIRRMKKGFSLEKCLKSWNGTGAGTVADGEKIFKELGFHKVEKATVHGKEYYYANRNKIGVWGAWLCHLGMLIIIIGFGFGQMKSTEYVVYGVAGQTKPVDMLPYEVTIDNFEIKLREDETVEQYLADITVTNTETGESQSGSTSVNHPATMFGMKFYQNSTGWATDVSVWKGEDLVQEELLCAGEYLETEGKEGLYLMFRSFYPDYVEDELGNARTASSALNNPKYLYTLYYKDQVLGMNIIGENEKITVDDYTYVFHNPKSYTLIQIKNDPFTWLAAVGGLLMVVALLLAFYVRPEELWAEKQTDGTWVIAGKSKKGGAIFEEKIQDACQEVK